MKFELQCLLNCALQQEQPTPPEGPTSKNGVAVKELISSYHNEEPPLCTICPCYGNYFKFHNGNPRIGFRA